MTCPYLSHSCDVICILDIGSREMVKFAAFFCAVFKDDFTRSSLSEKSFTLTYRPII